MNQGVWVPFLLKMGTFSIKDTRILYVSKRISTYFSVFPLNARIYVSLRIVAYLNVFLCILKDTLKYV